MNIEKATYSYKAVNEAIKKVKAQNWTITKKASHSALATEVKGLFQFCYEKTNCLLFDPDFEPYIIEYCRAAYNYKNYTKKELDIKLGFCKRFLQRELTNIYNMMLSGEVNTTD